MVRTHILTGKDHLMTTLDTSAPRISTSRALYRTAGIAALAAGLMYILQPIIVFVLSPQYPAGTPFEDTFPDPSELGGASLLATLSAVEFFAVGLATIIAALALGRLTARTGAGVWATAGQVTGVVSGAAWILMAGMTLANSGTVAQALSEVGADAGAQRVGLQAVNIVITGFIAVVAFCTATWLASLATAGRRAGVIGLPLAIASIVVAALITVALLVLNVPFGVLLLIPYFIGLGIALLVKSRRADG
jgi:hypothetical protein